MSTFHADHPARENGTAGSESRFETQGLLPDRELVKTSKIVTLKQVEQVLDEADQILKDTKSSTENGVMGFASPVCDQTTKPDETSEQKESENEVFENNIQIRNPSPQIEDGGIPLGVHVRKAEQGFRVHRIIPGGHIDKSPTRENDVIIGVGDSNIGSLSLEELQEFFWQTRLDIDATIKLTIIRRENEEDKNEADVEFATRTLTIYLNVWGDEVDHQTGRENDEGHCYTPEKYNITIHDNNSDDVLYLCVEEDIPRFQSLLRSTDLKDPKFQWKMQLCHSPEIGVNFLLCNVENKKYLRCDDEDGSGDNKTLIMCDGKAMSTKGTVSADRRWFQRLDYDGESGKFSLQSLGCKGWYLAVNNNTYVLTITQTPSLRHFFVRFKVQKAL